MDGVAGNGCVSEWDLGPQTEWASLDLRLKLKRL